MKKPITFLLFIFFINTAYAQFTYGVKAGFGAAWISGNTYTNPSLGQSYQAGVFGNYRINKNFSAQLEALFSKKGQSANTDVNGNVTGYDLNLSYVEVPIAAKFNFSEERISPYVMMGAAPSYLIFGRQNGTALIDAPRFDFGLIGALGVDIDLEKFGLLFELRYNKGFSSSYYKNNTLGLMVGVRF